MSGVAEEPARALVVLKSDFERFACVEVAETT